MQLTPPLTTRAVILGLVFGFAISASMISLVKIGRINERVPESERFSYFRWRTKRSEIRRKFKELYPESKLTLLLNLCVTLMVGCCVIAVWVLANWKLGRAGG
jgi:hypothetical protein